MNRTHVNMVGTGAFLVEDLKRRKLIELCFGFRCRSGILFDLHARNARIE
jgi:hypothetical protein